MQELTAIPESFAKLLAQPQLVVLVVLLVTAAVIDWRTFRIPNWLTVGGMVFGVLYSAVSGQTLTSGPLNALAGLGLGLVALLPLYVLRVMGAGDVKLMAMTGAFVGFPNIIYAVLFTFVTGGIAAVAFAIRRRAFRRMTNNVTDIVQWMAFATIAGQRFTPGIAGGDSIGRLPYGASIATGTIAWLAARQLGYA